MLQVVRYYNHDQFVVAVRGDAGRKYIPLVFITNRGVVRRDVPLDEERGFREIDYPIRKAVVGMKRVGKKHGITKGALELLEE